MTKTRAKIQSRIEKLLEETPEAYYWVGFLLADGNLCGNRIKIALSVSDLDHLKKFAAFIEMNPDRICIWTRPSDGYTYCSIAIVNALAAKGLREKFGFRERKTYNPPIVTHELNDLLISMYAGFVDGDGCIRNLHLRNDFNIAIKCHSSWLDFLTKLQSDLYKFFEEHKHGYISTALINSRGYAYVTLSNVLLLGKLKAFLKGLNLPIMTRKWDVIDESYVDKYRSRVNNTKENHRRIIELYEQGNKVSLISSALGIKYSTVYNCLRRRSSHET